MSQPHATAVAPALGKVVTGGGIRSHEEARFAWLSLTPALLFFAVFVGFPVLYSFYLSFHDWNMMSPQPAWVGLENYTALLRDELFIRSLVQTTIFTAGITGCIVVLSLVTALLLDQRLRQIWLYRTIYYLPAVTSVVAIGIVWLWIFDPQFGLINQTFKAMGVVGPRWLSDQRLALPTLILTAAWRNVGYFATIFLAGLQGIDTMYYEAARIDGAGTWGCFRRITLPLLRPTTLFVLIMSVILSFQVFALVYVMTGGGPAGSTSVIVFYLYQQAFTYFRMGYACAIGYVLFGIIFLLTLVQFKFFGKQVEM
ncbi:MAG TPA: sugar ABC transporter permease [Candidatus Acidoferrum sp.]|nr:sugar ABC transporter permease [Candidatus Acidoferrum sp.]